MNWQVTRTIDSVHVGVLTAFSHVTPGQVPLGAYWVFTLGTSYKTSRWWRI